MYALIEENKLSMCTPIFLVTYVPHKTFFELLYLKVSKFIIRLYYILP